MCGMTNFGMDFHILVAPNEVLHLDPSVKEGF